MPSADATLEVGRLYGGDSRDTLDYEAVLLAVFWLNVALMLGHAWDCSCGCCSRCWASSRWR
ncbi:MULTISPECIES: hypothetical protein [unclassified Luteimonas]